MRDALGIISAFGAIGLTITTLIVSTAPELVWVPKLVSVFLTAGAIFLVLNACEHLKNE